MGSLGSKIKIMSKLIVGFITYGELTAKYLPYFLSSLEAQTFKDFKIIAIDNTESAINSPAIREPDEYMSLDGQVAKVNENIEFIENNYLSQEAKGKLNIEIGVNNKNVGFAKAYNQIIKKAVENEAKYLLVINPDVILESDAIEKMISALEADKKLASVSPKVLQWNFDNNKKMDIIDTCGIKLKSGLRFIDLGQNEKDDNQYLGAEIIGPSGACGMYRLEALEKVAFARGENTPPTPLNRGEAEFFDELMFMYKEDCDLACRLALAGYKSKCVSEAVVYHDRSASAAGNSDLQIALNRKNKTRQVKTWSFLNQQIIFIKYWRLQNWKNKLTIIWYEIKTIIFVMLFERYLIRQYSELIRIKNKITRY